jgi:hypothetical protein
MITGAAMGKAARFKFLAKDSPHADVRINQIVRPFDELTQSRIVAGDCQDCGGRVRREETRQGKELSKWT